MSLMVMPESRVREPGLSAWSPGSECYREILTLTPIF
jgi:hypothetical protein